MESDIEVEIQIVTENNETKEGRKRETKNMNEQREEEWQLTC